MVGYVYLQTEITASASIFPEQMRLNSQRAGYAASALPFARSTAAAAPLPSLLLTFLIAVIPVTRPSIDGGNELSALLSKSSGAAAGTSAPATFISPVSDLARSCSA